MEEEVLNVEGELFQVMSDGRRVWVNHPTGCAAARFGPNGIDVHQVPEGTCLFCTHGKTSREDYDLFVLKVQEAFGLVVSPEHMPSEFAIDRCFRPRSRWCKSGGGDARRAGGYSPQIGCPVCFGFPCYFPAFPCDK